VEDNGGRRRFSAESAPKLIGGFVLLQLLWFSLVYPLVPSTLTGFLMEFGAGLCLLIVLYVVGSAIVWLSGQATRVRVYRSLAVALALSVGILVFATVYEFKAAVSENFHYFIFVHH
jgi:hypothetical protein